jgi:hypothetical protein
LVPGFATVSVCRASVPTLTRSTMAYDAYGEKAACGIVITGVAGHVK